jgi:hypothetical protein
MEVHAHAHTARKKWYHYFWEFFMLFLAVTLGFLVENQREHFAEYKKEIQYIHSYIEDLHSDIKQLDSMISHCKKRNEMADSLIYMLDSPDRGIYGKDIYYYARVLTLNFPFFSTDRTIQQLKNGGNLRLISKQAVSNAMMNYDHQVRWLDDIRGREEDYVRDYVKWLEQTCDTRVFDKMILKGFGFARPEGNPHLIKEDKATILEFIGKLHFVKSANTYLLINYEKLIQTAQETLDVIKKEYHLK